MHAINYFMDFPVKCVQEGGGDGGLTVCATYFLGKRMFLYNIDWSQFFKPALPESAPNVGGGEEGSGEEGQGGLEQRGRERQGGGE